MKKNKRIIKYPSLNDRGGDLQKQWYVEWSFYAPTSDKPTRQRNWISKGDAAARRARAAVIISEKTEWLKTGAYLCDALDVTPVSSAQTYRREATRYNSARDANSNENLAALFLAYKNPSCRQKTFFTYKSKITIITEWFTQSEILFVNATNSQIVEFLRQLSVLRGLSRTTIAQYANIMRALWGWLIRNNFYSSENPAINVPHYGRVVDLSPLPISDDDILRLRALIIENEPMLWLGCLFQYYGAIRPGNEMRHLKIKDLDSKNCMVTISAEFAKNKKTEKISLPHYVIDYADKLGIFTYNENLYIFGSHWRPSAKPLGENTMRIRFNFFRDNLKLPHEIKFYSWKHTGAIAALMAGIPAYQLSEHLRHTRLDTTEHYIRKRKPTDFSESPFFKEI